MQRTLLVFLFSIALATTAVSRSVIINNTLMTTTNDDDIIKLVQKLVYGEKVIQMSFNRNYGDVGSLQVYNSANVLVYNQNEAELIGLPHYSTITVTDFAAGEYTFVLKVNGNKYSSTIIIK